VNIVSISPRTLARYWRERPNGHAGRLVVMKLEISRFWKTQTTAQVIRASQGAKR